MALLGVFPYSINDQGEGYIFSALDVECSHEDFNAALEAGDITETYKTLLITNLWTGKEGPKPAYFAPVDLE